MIPEPGDIFKTVIGQGPGAKLVLVQAVPAENPDDCSGCIFETLCRESNKTLFICYGEDRHDGISVKIVPFAPETE